MDEVGGSNPLVPTNLLKLFIYPLLKIIKVLTCQLLHYRMEVSASFHKQ